MFKFLRDAIRALTGDLLSVSWQGFPSTSALLLFSFIFFFPISLLDNHSFGLAVSLLNTCVRGEVKSVYVFCVHFKIFSDFLKICLCGWWYKSMCVKVRRHLCKSQFSSLTMRDPGIKLGSLGPLPCEPSQWLCVLVFWLAISLV